MSYLQEKEYSIQEMIDLKKELENFDLSIVDEITPINWQDGNIAITNKNFYITYLDHEIGGVNVKVISKIDKKIKIEKGFLNVNEAQAWIVKHHHDAKDGNNE